MRCWADHSGFAASRPDRRASTPPRVSAYHDQIHPVAAAVGRRGAVGVRSVAAAFVIGITRAESGTALAAATGAEVHRFQRRIQFVHAGTILAVGIFGRALACAFGVTEDDGVDGLGDGCIRRTDQRAAAGLPAVPKIRVVVTVTAEYSVAPATSTPPGAVWAKGLFIKGLSAPVSNGLRYAWGVWR